jgi:hypothetical protein
LQVSQSYSHLNFIVYRYADLLLLYAESLNELGDTNEAIAIINDYILDRARRSGSFSPGVEPVPANWSLSLTQEEVRAAIMEEREYELLGEGHETFDVRRRGKEYLKARIDISDDWHLLIRDDTHWNYNNKANYFNVESYAWHRIYREYEPYVTDPLNFSKKHLFIPFPQREINLNGRIPDDDQNFGW